MKQSTRCRYSTGNIYHGFITSRVIIEKWGYIIHLIQLFQIRKTIIRKAIERTKYQEHICGLFYILKSLQTQGIQRRKHAERNVYRNQVWPQSVLCLAFCHINSLHPKRQLLNFDLMINVES